MPPEPRQTRVLGIRLTPATITAIRSAAVADGRTLSWLAARILEDWVRAQAQRSAVIRMETAYQDAHKPGLVAQKPAPAPTKTAQPPRKGMFE